MRRLRIISWIALSIFIFCSVPLFLFNTGCKKKEDRAKIIRFVTWRPHFPEVWDELVKKFEAIHPDIKIVREIGPHSSTAFHDLLTQKLKNKSPEVDVFLMDVIWPPEFAAAGWAMPLDDLFEESEREKFLEGPIMANTYEGKIYGVPLFIDSGMLYYRKDLLEKYGFSPPRTWQEMVKQAETIVQGELKKGVEMYGFSGQFRQYEGLVCNMMEYILSNGGYIINPETGRPEIADKPAIEAVRFVRDEIIGKIAPRGSLTYAEPESLALFVQGRAVFHRNWPYAWEVSNDPVRSNVAGKVGLTLLPSFPGGRSYSTLGGWQLGISNFSKNKKASWEFIKFLASQETQKVMALRTGRAPTRKALYEDEEIINACPHFSDMKDVFLTAYPRPISPLYPAISHLLQRYFSRVLSNKDSDIKSEAENTSQEIERILKIKKVK